MVQLANAGYRVVVPDQRGYNLSDKPSGVESYRIERLTADIRELIRVCGRERAVIVAHDWGGAVAWRFAMDYASAVRPAFSDDDLQVMASALAQRGALRAMIDWFGHEQVGLQPQNPAAQQNAYVYQHAWGRLAKIEQLEKLGHLSKIY